MVRELVYRKCSYCGGKGMRAGRICPACDGDGIQKLGIFEGDQPATLTYKKCPTCGGDGVYLGRRCPNCGGSGHKILDFHFDEY